MTARRKRAADSQTPGDTGSAGGGDGSPHAALERILAHAESHGESYVGAVDDQATVRAALSDGTLAGDKRIPAAPETPQTPAA